MINYITFERLAGFNLFSTEGLGIDFDNWLRPSTIFIDYILITDREH